MTYSKELQEKIDELGLSKENILYLTIANEYLHAIRIGEKDVEYRDLSEFYLNKLFKKDKFGKYSAMKPIKYLLLQGGYSLNSPRMLVELKGWVIEGVSYPSDLERKDYVIYDDSINLLLGEIAYDSVNFSILIPTQHRERKKQEKVEVAHPKYLKPINLVEVEYAQTGRSKRTNEMGMREMQQKAYEARSAKYLLIKHHRHQESPGH